MNKNELKLNKEDQWPKTTHFSKQNDLKEKP